MDAVLAHGRESSVTERIVAAAGAIVMATGAAALWYFDPANESFFPVCPLYRFTGFACPGCGMTRAFHAMFHGDIAAALDLNALAPVFVLLIGFFFISLILFAARGRGLKTELRNPYLLWTALIVLLAFGLLRNLPFYPFNILFP
jgi:hypothetical protein